MKSFVYSTLKNIAAFGISGLVQLFGASLFVSFFGLSGQGLLSMFRLCLPASLPSIFDASVAEIAALSIARGRANGEWTTTRHTLQALFLLALSGGILVGALFCLIAAAGHLYFKMSREQVSILMVSAAAFPFFFVALIGEGILRGFERYGTLRLAELLVTTVVALCPLLPFVADVLTVVWIQLLLFALRALALLIIGYRQIKSHSHIDWVLNIDGIRSVWPEIKKRAANGMSSKVLSMIDMRAQPLLITPIWGVTAAGLYDLLSRMPLLIKTVAGLLNQAVMPAAVRVDTGGDQAKFNQILIVGITLIACLVWPPLAVFAVGSDSFLHLWVGSRTAGNAFYMVMMLLVPASMVLVGFLAQALFGRFDFSRHYLRVHIKQVALNYLFAMLLSVWLGANAFLLCTGIGWLLALPFYLRHAANIAGLDLKEVGLPIIHVGLACLIITLLGRSSGMMREINNWFEWVICCGIFSAMTYLIVWFILPRDIRKQLRYYVLSRMRRFI